MVVLWCEGDGVVHGLGQPDRVLAAVGAEFDVLWCLADAKHAVTDFRAVHEPLVFLVCTRDDHYRVADREFWQTF
jgi:hypothetical protein